MQGLLGMCRRFLERRRLVIKSENVITEGPIGVIKGMIDGIVAARHVCSQMIMKSGRPLRYAVERLTIRSRSHVLKYLGTQVCRGAFW